MADHVPPMPAVFTPEAVAAINRAYGEALAMLGAGQDGEQLRHKLADHMMFLARSGETDEKRLCRLSVTAVLGRMPEPRSMRVPNNLSIERR